MLKGRRGRGNEGHEARLPPPPALQYTPAPQNTDAKRTTNGGPELKKSLPLGTNTSCERPMPRRKGGGTTKAHAVHVHLMGHRHTGDVECSDGVVGLQPFA